MLGAGVDTGASMTSRTRPDRSEPDVVRVCLVSDPDLASEIAGRLAEELPELLRQRLSPAPTWEIRRVTAALQADEQVGVTSLTVAIGDSVPDQCWDALVFITDLPRRSGRRPIAAELDAAHRLAIVSIPTMGFVGIYRRVREAVVRLIAELIVSDHRPAAGAKRARLPSVSTQPLPAADGGPAAGLRLVGSRWLGTPRMVTGMVRANRPWRLFLGLSRSLAGVFAAAAYAMINDTAWRIGDALGPRRQVALAVCTIAILVLWLIIDHELWERSATPDERARATLYNITTAITLTVGVLCLYGTLFVGMMGTQALLLDTTSLARVISHAPRWSDRIAVAWFITSSAIVGGALGAGFEDDSVVRRATYGQRQRERSRQQASS
jgi:hypothetical protein